VLAVVLGSALRAWQLSAQVVADDEWHGLKAALTRSTGWILTHFGRADHSIPLAVFEKILLGTIGVSEVTIRLPSLVAGVAFLALCPSLLPGTVDRATRWVFAWLMALSPLHVYFSRYARPYSVALLCAFAGILAFVRWWDTGARPFAALYVVCAVLGSYHHVTVIPALAAPVLGVLPGSLRGGGSTGPRGKALALVAGAAALGVAATLGPPLWIDWATLAARTARDQVTWATLIDAGGLFLGTREPLALFALAPVAAYGMLVLWRLAPTLAGSLLLACAAALTLSFVTRPHLIQLPFVLARYTIVLLPVALLCLAVATRRFDAALAGLFPRWPAGLAGVTLCGLITAVGPLRDIYYWPNNWTNHGLFQYAYDPTSRYSYAPRLTSRPPSPFYTWLSRYAHGDLLLLEAPWYLQWHCNAYPVYQRVHRQRTVIGLSQLESAHAPGITVLTTPGIRLSTFVDLSDPEAVCRRGVDYAILHTDLQREMAPEEPAMSIAPWIELYRRRYGPAVYRDATVVVFAVNGTSPSCRGRP
jgi:hypothetical protein